MTDALNTVETGKKKTYLQRGALKSYKSRECLLIFVLACFTRRHTLTWGVDKFAATSQPPSCW